MERFSATVLNCARADHRNPVISRDDRKQYCATQMAHAVQAKIVYRRGDSKQFVGEDNRNENFDRLIGATFPLPTSWNQGIDRTVDRVQEQFIGYWNNYYNNTMIPPKYVRGRPRDKPAESKAANNDQMEDGMACPITHNSPWCPTSGQNSDEESNGKSGSHSRRKVR